MTSTPPSIFPQSIGNFVSEAMPHAAEASMLVMGVHRAAEFSEDLFRFVNATPKTQSYLVKELPRPLKTLCMVGTLPTMIKSSYDAFGNIASGNYTAQDVQTALSSSVSIAALVLGAFVTAKSAPILTTASFALNCVSLAIDVTGFAYAATHGSSSDELMFNLANLVLFNFGRSERQLYSDGLKSYVHQIKLERATAKFHRTPKPKGMALGAAHVDELGVEINGVKYPHGTQVIMGKEVSEPLLPADPPEEGMAVYRRAQYDEIAKIVGPADPAKTQVVALIGPSEAGKSLVCDQIKTAYPGLEIHVHDVDALTTDLQKLKDDVYAKMSPGSQGLREAHKLANRLRINLEAGIHFVLMTSEVPTSSLAYLRFHCGQIINLSDGAALETVTFPYKVLNERQRGEIDRHIGVDGQARTIEIDGAQYFVTSGQYYDYLNLTGAGDFFDRAAQARSIRHLTDDYNGRFIADETTGLFTIDNRRDKALIYLLEAAENRHVSPDRIRLYRTERVPLRVEGAVQCANWLGQVYSFAHGRSPSDVEMVELLQTLRLRTIHMRRPMIMWPTMVRAALLHAANGGAPFTEGGENFGLRRDLAEAMRGINHLRPCKNTIKITGQSEPWEDILRPILFLFGERPSIKSDYLMRIEDNLAKEAAEALEKNPELAQDLFFEFLRTPFTDEQIDGWFVA